MIYENASGTHKTPRWAQTLLNRSRHPACVLLDIVGKARKDGAQLLVRYRGAFPELTALALEFADMRQIKITAHFAAAASAGLGCIVELVPDQADCVLESRVSKLAALRSKLRPRRQQRGVPPDISEYCLYFERAGKRVSAFEFYIDPRQSQRLIAAYYGAHDVLKLLEKDPDDDDDDDSDSDFVDQQQQPLSGMERKSTDKGQLQFIKIV